MKLEMLSLDDALEDNPQTRSLTRVFEEDATVLCKFATNVLDSTEKTVRAQTELHLAMDELAKNMRLYGSIEFPVNRGEDVGVRVFDQLASMVAELSSLLTLLTKQCSDCVLYPLTKFVHMDLAELNMHKAGYHDSSEAFDTAVLKHSKLSRKDSPKKIEEISTEFSSTKERFHQASVQYFMSLNSLQYRRYSSVIEPIVKFISAWRSTLHIGNDSLNNTSKSEQLNSSQELTQSLHSELEEESKAGAEFLRTVCQVHRLQMDMYLPEPSLNAGLVANRSMNHKTGYVFIKVKSGMSSQWERYYLYIQGGNLMYQKRDDIGAQQLIELSSDVIVFVNDHEDRRFVFQVTSDITQPRSASINIPGFHQPSVDSLGSSGVPPIGQIHGKKRHILLQATNFIDRDEWIYTIMNIVSGTGKNNNNNRTTTVVGDDVQAGLGQNRGTTAMGGLGSKSVVSSADVPLQTAGQTSTTSPIGIPAVSGSSATFLEPPKKSSDALGDVGGGRNALSPSSGYASGGPMPSMCTLMMEGEDAYTMTGTMPLPPPPTPLDQMTHLTDARFELLRNSMPIQFDIISSSIKSPSAPSADPPAAAAQTLSSCSHLSGGKRINPFDTNDSPVGDNQTAQGHHLAATSCSDVFVPNESPKFLHRVGFVGSVEVPLDRGLDVVRDAIKLISVARSTQNIGSMNELEMRIYEDSLHLTCGGAAETGQGGVDGLPNWSSSAGICASFALPDISYWGDFPEMNDRLAGLIVRWRGGRSDGKNRYHCYVLESRGDDSGQDLCSDIQNATQSAFEKLLIFKTRGRGVSSSTMEGELSLDKDIEFMGLQD